jgi:hypothetical protein
VTIFVSANFIRFISYIFEDKNLKKATTLGINPSPPFASLKKIQIILRCLVEEGIYFIFNRKFHLPDLFFTNSFCCNLRPCAMKFGAGCTCYFILSRVVYISIL